MMDWLKFVMHWEWWQVALIVLLTLLLLAVGRSPEVRLILAFWMFLPAYWLSEWAEKRSRENRRW